MFRKCPKCGSRNTYCINRGEQISDFIKKDGWKFAGAATANFIGGVIGRPDIGKSIGNMFAGPLSSDVSSIYKCQNCGKEWVP